MLEGDELDGVSETSVPSSDGESNETTENDSCNEKAWQDKWWKHEEMSESDGSELHGGIETIEHGTFEDDDDLSEHLSTISSLEV